MTSTEERVRTIAHWRHRIELPDGVVTPGTQDTQAQLAMLHLPADLRGKSVLDIGCSDGFFSFECEKRGAARVLAIDNFSSMYVDSPSGFHVARELLASRVEFRQADLFSLDVREIGSFDLVLFLGVLYHLRHPLLAIEHLAGLCADQLVLETELASPRGVMGALKRRLVGADNAASSMLFHEGDEVNRDPTNWWSPTARCVEAMLRSSGFCDVKTVARRRARGVIQGFSPRHGADVPELERNYGSAEVARHLNAILGESNSEASLESRLRSLSIPQFAMLRQTLAEDRSKRWHQHDKWSARA